ncbi:hypothetical protein OG978_03165 [Streptomyces sp. NBC_01591]|uniref:hypothetical protein n=1 Tax=Streptomyces sp. NBC_01591 TaxID=2975888 RepID=UPI002DD8841E|nr:hypothetical protein [Streptomyces sp. NBC_01591]WSD66478.1 hypothetical protein OG978_03165 [Streptomyces sp. NBC_01591]
MRPHPSPDCTGLLAAREGATLPTAFLAVGAAFAGSVMFFHPLIATTRRDPYGDRTGPNHVQPGEGEGLLPPHPTRPPARPGGWVGL